MSNRFWMIMGLAFLAWFPLRMAVSYAQDTILQTEGTVTPSTRSVSFQQLSTLERQLDQARRDYLTTAGWTYINDNPWGLWRWFKTIDGVDYRMSEEDAVFAQNRIDESAQP